MTTAELEKNENSKILHATIKLYGMVPAKMGCACKEIIIFYSRMCVKIIEEVHI
jgi:hypothetical protein